MMNITVNRNIFEEKLEGDYSTTDSEFLNVHSMERVDAILINLQKMAEDSKNTPSEYLWKTKVNEFRRQLKWNSLRVLSSGSERKTQY